MTIYPEAAWWANDGAKNVTPSNERTPEGFEPGAFCAMVLRGLSVVELGCGDGRLAGHFETGRYVGLDVCAAGLRDASDENPDHTFTQYEPWSTLPPSDAVLAWQVLLHVPDDQLPHAVAAMAGRTVLIGECMSREWRRDGDPPVFNRGAGECIDAFSDTHALAGFCNFPIRRYESEAPDRAHLTAMLLEPR